ncbi:alpha-galactosidase [Dysgonomonas reticulitermitis]
MLFLFGACKNTSQVSNDVWTIKYNKELRTINVEKSTEFLIKDLYASYKLNGSIVTTRDYKNSASILKTVSDNFGTGQILQITYMDKKLPKLTQSFYLYPDRDYILTDFILESEDGEIESNYMATVNIGHLGKILPKGDNRALFIPFDNDAWIRFQSHPLPLDSLLSYEVSAVFDNESRKGLVVGSVEHTDWKTAVRIGKSNNDSIGSLTCYAGVADNLTRDSKEHGAIKGKVIKSPKVYLGYCTDWRTGLEEYGEANAITALAKEWKKSMPFGWNSWGALQFNLTYKKALEVSDWIKGNIQKDGFYNRDNKLVVWLDSGWDSFTEEELKAFVQKCKNNGQLAGIYWVPFTDWGKNPEREVEYATEYKFKDIYLYANGKPQELDGAYAIDPTHPAIEKRMEAISALFRRCGFEYVKMDFMTHGIMEADSWYKPEIQTGVQAYNYGMRLLNKYFNDMYLNLSISPIFPSNYAQSRRIACDAWNQIKDTEYTMNALSYGWWIGKAYLYNDADHIVLRDATEGENRARITSSAITGLYITGDDYSADGKVEGKERSNKFLTNPGINAMAIGKSFRPVEGNGEKSENQFVYTDSNGVIYYVIFNYGDSEIEVFPSFERIGLNNPAAYKAEELWSGQPVDLKKAIIIPAKDVKVLKISAETL